MLLLTLLGIIALLLRGRRVNNAPSSHQDEKMENDDVPPIWISDDWGEDPLLGEPSDGQSEEPSQEEPADVENEPPQEESANDQSEEASQEEAVNGENKPPQEEIANDQDEEPSQKEAVSGENKPPQEKPDDDRDEEPSQEEAVSGETKSPQEEPADDRDEEPSQEEAVNGENKPAQEEPADDWYEEPSQEEAVNGENKPPQEEPAEDQDEEPFEEAAVNGENKQPQGEPADDQDEKRSQEEAVIGENKPPQEEPAYDRDEERSQEEAVIGENKPPQEVPADDRDEERSQEEAVNGEYKPPQEETDDDRDEEPSQEEPVDSLIEPSQEEPVDGQKEPPQENADAHPVSNLTRSSSSSNFFSASCNCGSSEDDVPQGLAGKEEDPVPPRLRQLKNDETINIVINSRGYEISGKLGEGGFGAVYAGTRLEDGFLVAIKFSSFVNNKFLSIDGFDKPLPAEIALHYLATQGPKVSEIIELLDWQVYPKRYTMVLEHPIPCQSLYTYWEEYQGNIEEDKLRKIMHQVTTAAQMCCQRRVFHRDIKLQNLLINPCTLEIKLIDFGCGDLLTDTSYLTYSGTRRFLPPEYVMFRRYYGEPTTVWSVGIVLYLLIFRQYPEIRDLQRISDKNLKIKNMSKECCNFLQCCLEWDYKQRIELQKLSLHSWFKVFSEGGQERRRRNILM